MSESAEASGDSDFGEDEYDSGMGDDEELQIGGKVAGMTQGPVVENITNTTATNTMQQNLMVVGPSMQMMEDPYTGYAMYVPVPGY